MKSVSGHKSDSSLEIYEKVSDEDKIEMGINLGEFLTVKPKQLALPALKVPLTLPPPNPQQNMPMIMPGPSIIKWLHTIQQRHVVT